MDSDQLSLFSCVEDRVRTRRTEVGALMYAPFITFAAYSYDVVQALEVPSKVVKALATPVPHLGAKAARVHTKTAFTSSPGTLDVTPRLQEVMEHLD